MKRPAALPVQAGAVINKLLLRVGIALAVRGHGPPLLVVREIVPRVRGVHRAVRHAARSGHVVVPADAMAQTVVAVLGEQRIIRGVLDPAQAAERVVLVLEVGIRRAALTEVAHGVVRHSLVGAAVVVGVTRIKFVGLAVPRTTAGVRVVLVQFVGTGVRSVAVEVQHRHAFITPTRRTCAEPASGFQRESV